MARRVVFTGRKIQVAIETETLADGSQVQRDVVIHPGAVAIVPIVDADHICLVRNRRLIVGEELLEIPAGTLEPGEAPDTAAVRELAEETGYSAKNWRKLAEFYPSPGVLSERTHLYLATGLSAGPMHLEAGEELVPQVVSWSDAMKWAVEGTIRDAKTLIGLLLLDRTRSNYGPGLTPPG
jgi:ADP-ribose pyrophosphatase